MRPPGPQCPTAGKAQNSEDVSCPSCRTVSPTLAGVSVLVKSVKSLQTPLTPRMSHEVEADMPWGTLGRALPPTEGGPGRQRPGWTPLSQQQGPSSTCGRPHLRSQPCFPTGSPSSLSPRGWQRHLHLAGGGPGLAECGSGPQPFPAILGQAAIGVGRRQAGRVGEWAAKHLSRGGREVAGTLYYPLRRHIRNTSSKLRPEAEAPGSTEPPVMVLVPLCFWDRQVPRTTPPGGKGGNDPLSQGPPPRLAVWPSCGLSRE